MNKIATASLICTLMFILPWVSNAADLNKPPISKGTDVGRYQLLQGEYQRTMALSSSITHETVRVILKIDTVTGEVWELSSSATESGDVVDIKQGFEPIEKEMKAPAHFFK